MGDLYSCPADYFKFDEYQKTNFLDLHLTKSKNRLPNLIFGGGGMLHEELIELFEKFAYHPLKNKLIVWGAGINEHDLNKQYFPMFLNKFSLVGLRDYNNPYEYVPCVSCMDKELNNNKEPITDIVIYHHCNTDIPIETKYKRSNRKSGAETLKDVIEFLCKGEIIITNSYHGAYWGAFLKRKVMIYEPFSNRFLGFKPKIPICDKNNWKEIVKIVKPVYPEYLEECREINKRFHKKVLEIISDE